MNQRLAILAGIFLSLLSCAFGQGNGKLQIHFIDVGQGDSAVLISPSGQVVLFDVGKDLKVKSCDKPLSYLDQLGVKHIDFMFVSHYHFDHIGCVPDVLGQFPMQGDVYDRGESYPGATFDHYVAAVGGHRKTGIPKSTVIKLDANTANEVVITVVAVNGAGVPTKNENDLSLATTVTFGSFKAEISGDLSGEEAQDYKDIESPIVSDVGRVDVYKVHHHCSSYSTNENWLNTIHPTIGIVSAGDGNTYGHPAADCLERLHKHNVKTYWTETAQGEPESGLDVVGGNIVVEVAPGATTYTVTYDRTEQDSYPIVGANPNNVISGNGTTMPKYAWSQKSGVYHLANCDFVKNINPENLKRGDQPPDGKNLHKDCPLVHSH